MPQGSELNALTAVYKDNTWIIPQEESERLKIYLGVIEDPMYINIGIQSRDGQNTSIGNSVSILIPSNKVLKAPILEIESDLYGDEDQILPIMRKNGGIISAQFRDITSGQKLVLKASNIPSGISLVRKIIGDDNIETYSLPLNKINNESNKSDLIMEYGQWNDIYIRGPHDGFGTYNIDIQATSLGDKVQASEVQELKIILSPVNDKPSIVDMRDLESVMEGAQGQWDLRGKFNDVDNTSEELVISVKEMESDGTRSNPYQAG